MDRTGIGGPKLQLWEMYEPPDFQSTSARKEQATATNGPCKVAGGLQDGIMPRYLGLERHRKGAGGNWELVCREVNTWSEASLRRNKSITPKNPGPAKASWEPKEKETCPTWSSGNNPGKPEVHQWCRWHPESTIISIFLNLINVQDDG